MNNNNAHEPSLSPALSLSSMSPLPKYNLRVLIVEDQKIPQKIAVKQFIKLGVEISNIHVADNGSVAVSMVKNSPSPYDIIYMDEQMPVMDGLEATVKIRDEERELKLKKSFIFTCSSSYEGIFPGADAKLEKPMNLVKLNQLIDAALSPPSLITHQPLQITLENIQPIQVNNAPTPVTPESECCLMQCLKFMFLSRNNIRNNHQQDKYLPPPAQVMPMEI